MENTLAPSVAHHLTTHRTATVSNLLVINTPFIADARHSMLLNTPLFNKFSDVPYGIQYGFDMGIIPSHTFTPPNHKSALSFPGHVLSHIGTELSRRRYSGPFSRSRLESLIGPFRTSPLGTVLKSELSDERRIVQDLSFPRNDPSHRYVNDYINVDDFRCDWGTFNDVVNIVLDAPTGTEAATLDVDSAFRCCPIAPSQQPNFVIHWNDLFYIDHNAPFVASSSGGVFSKVADAMTAIFSSRGLGPSKNWVDDFVFFRYLRGRRSPRMAMEGLRQSLSHPFSNTWVSSGTYPVNQFKFKKSRYFSKLQLWTEGHKFSRREAESVLDLLHPSTPFRPLSSDVYPIQASSRISLGGATIYLANSVAPCYQNLLLLPRSNSGSRLRLPGVSVSY